MPRDGLMWMDSDMHLAEPGDLWQHYVKPHLRDAVPELTGVQPDYNVLARSTIPAIEQIRGTRTHMFEEFLSPDGRCIDAAGQLKAMDREGIDVAILFPTAGRRSKTADPALLAALHSAYNSWLHDFASYEPKRLKVNAIVSLLDVDAAVAEVRRATTELGAVSVSLEGQTDQTRLYDPKYEPLWAEAERHGIAIGLHNFVQMFGRYGDKTIYSHPTGRPIEHACALTELLFGGVMERHPRLRFVFLEAGCSWVPYWLFRLEEEWEKFRPMAPELAANVTMPPIDYWRRQCFSSVEVDEWPLRSVLDTVGGDNLVLSSDFPHFDSAFPHARDRFMAIPGVTTEAKAKILWDNCARLYNLN
ncbi:MAG TPA: amidohydrolase family protein [Chloroflexota bacterium]|nr:amidohydrolase family protein [Chloroflexota bacterium]